MFNTIVVYVIYMALLLVSSFWLGLYMAKVYNNELTWADKMLNPVARLFYRFSGVDPTLEMTWWQYTKALLWFNLLGFLAELMLLLAQQLLPLNPAGIPNMSFWTARHPPVICRKCWR